MDVIDNIRFGIMRKIISEGDGIVACYFWWFSMLYCYWHNCRSAVNTHRRHIFVCGINEKGDEMKTLLILIRAIRQAISGYISAEKRISIISAILDKEKTKGTK